MAIAAEARARLIKDFPHLAHLLDNPDLGAFWDDIYNRATTVGISDGEFAQLFWQTNWFKERSGTARQWDTLITQDPGEANRRRTKTSFDLRNVATQWGIKLTTQQLDTMVEQQLRWGMSDAEMKASLATMGTGSPASPGRLTSTRDQMKAIASSYFQREPDASLQEYSRSIMSGSLTLEGFESLMRDRAKQDFAHLSEKLDGFTMEQLTGGMRSRLATLLDRDTADIDMTSPRFSQLINMTDDNGVTRMATTSETEKFARKQSEYRGSSTGRRQGVALLNSITSAMGAKRG